VLCLRQPPKSFLSDHSVRAPIGNRQFCVIEVDMRRVGAKLRDPAKGSMLAEDNAGQCRPCLRGKLIALSASTIGGINWLSLPHCKGVLNSASDSQDIGTPHRIPDHLLLAAQG